jgi:hypothetical protein
LCCRLWGSPKSQLKVFNLDGSSFKVEKANFDERKRRREVWFYGTREKSYCLFVMGNDGTPITLKTSARTIGQYRSPYPIDRERRWIGEAWQYAICEVLAQPMDTPTWFELPATSQLTLTTRKLMDHYQKTCDPFDFLEVAQLAYPGLLRCCGDGAEPAPGSMRGLTIPRPVHVTSIEHMGKEVIVDPTDTPEELPGRAAERDGSCDLSRYSQNVRFAARADPRRRHFPRGTRGRGEPFGRQDVREPRDDPHPSTIAKLEAALERLEA